MLRPGSAGRVAVAPAGAPAGYCCVRAGDGSGQCADRGGVRGVLSVPDHKCSYGHESSSFSHLFDHSSRFWSVGPSLTETVFDGGLRRATVNQFVTTYNADVAGYRQTVLTAFQQVEDSLAAVRLLSQQILQQQQAVRRLRRLWIWR